MKGRVGDRNKIWILDLIAENNNEITTSDLVEKTSLHRDTVYSNCKMLIEEGYITKNGKKGTYHLTLKAFNKPNLRGQNFAREAIIKPIKWRGSSFETQSEQQQTLLKLFEKYLEIIRTLDNNDNDNNVIQQELISYSVLMGAYTTFVFLEALNPDKWIFKQDGKKWEKGMSSLTEQEKDDVIKSWVKSAVNPLYLLMQFKRLNIVKRHDFEKLIKSYSQIFPDLYKQFEGINKRMNEPQQTERSDEEIYSEDKTGYLDSLVDERNKNKIKSSVD